MSNAERIDVAGELRARAAKWRVEMRNAETGALRIAASVVEVIDTWSEYQGHVGDVTADAWLSSSEVFGPGRGVGFWRRRADAVRTLDPTNSGAVARTLSHEAAVWLATSVPEAHRAATLFACHRYAREHGRALSKSIARRVYLDTSKTKPAAKVCGECERLRALLAEHGIATE